MDYVDIIKSRKPDIDTIYFGMNPAELWDIEQSNSTVQELALKYNSIFKENKEIQFEFILAHPDIQYWMGLEETELRNELQLYERIVTMCEKYKNVQVHYFGAEEWLISDRANYEDDLFSVNADTALTLSEAIGKNKYVASVDLMKAELQCLAAAVDKQNLRSNPCADLSEWNIVFLGDSIIGLEQSNTSIPNIVRRLTNANTYNLGIGGASASACEKSYCDLNQMIDAMLYENIDDIPKEKKFLKEVQRFHREYTKDDKICFVLNFGINDYIIAARVRDDTNPDNEETFEGALRTGIRKIKNEYPNGKFIIMAPTYIRSYSEGTKQKNIDGAVLQDYRIAVKNIADEFDIYYKNNYEDFEIDSQNYWVYYSDNIHLNGKGRFYYAKQFIEFMDKM